MPTTLRSDFKLDVPAPSGAIGERFYSLPADYGYLPFARYQVIAAGRNFFHIREASTGQIKGFRRGHNRACQLAAHLEIAEP